MVCVGLDPVMERMPEDLRGRPDPFFHFCRRIIEATRPYACAYKPQFAHFAAEGRSGELKAVLDYLREAAPECLAILDAKRGDIGSTAQQYAREAFAYYGADAVTVNPYMGGDTLQPFTDYRDRGVILLCKTSNPGSAELQDLDLANGLPLYLQVAEQASQSWNRHGNLALVVGATYPEPLARVRKIVGDMPVLVPGIGAQGGDLEATLRAGLRADGWGLLINSSRGILYASTGPDYAEAAARAAEDLRDACRRIQEAAS